MVCRPLGTPEDGNWKIETGNRQIGTDAVSCDAERRQLVPLCGWDYAAKKGAALQGNSSVKTVAGDTRIAGRCEAIRLIFADPCGTPALASKARRRGFISGSILRRLCTCRYVQQTHYGLGG